jgi:hypothetical protein
LPSGSEFVDGDYSPQVADAYRRIRDSPGDTPLAARSSGLDEDVIERMRQNLFVQKHDIATGPDTVEHGYFTPDGRLSGLWDKDGIAWPDADHPSAHDLSNLEDVVDRALRGLGR